MLLPHRKPIWKSKQWRLVIRQCSSPQSRWRWWCKPRPWKARWFLQIWQCVLRHQKWWSPKWRPKWRQSPRYQCPLHFLSCRQWNWLECPAITPHKPRWLRTQTKWHTIWCPSLFQCKKPDHHGIDHRVFLCRFVPKPIQYRRCWRPRMPPSTSRTRHQGHRR